VGASVLTPADAGGAGFAVADGVLHCDAVAASAIADAAGTPTYVYSASVVRRQYRRLAAALATAPHRIHYSVKANSNLAILRLLHGEGAGVDIV
jgi:diaminopimelate decarboxylase